jgi:hypothetical protein
MAEKLKNTFPEARIIVSLRNQLSFIKSFYKNYVNLGGKQNFHAYLYESFECHYGLLPKLEYDRFLGLYHELFGEDRVHVYLFEDLIRDPEQVLRGVQDFLGLTEPFVYQDEQLNVGLSPLATAIIRQLNRLSTKDFAQHYFQITALRGYSRRDYLRNQLAQRIRKVAGSKMLYSLGPDLLEPEDVSYINEHFAASNRRLSAMLGRDLRKSGYFAGGEE